MSKNLEFLCLSLYPWEKASPLEIPQNCSKVENPKSKTKTHQNSIKKNVFFLITSWNSTSFLIDPLESPHGLSSTIYTPGNSCPQPHCLDFFWNSPWSNGLSKYYHAIVEKNVWRFAKSLWKHSSSSFVYVTFSWYFVNRDLLLKSVRLNYYWNRLLEWYVTSTFDTSDTTVTLFAVGRLLWSYLEKGQYFCIFHTKPLTCDLIYNNLVKDLYL